MREELKGIYQKFLDEAYRSESSSWQSQEINKTNPMWEIRNVVFTLDDLHFSGAHEFNPDLPWCDIHFDERVSGKPLNPGESYKIWPYYNQGSVNNDQCFRRSGQFSHTYMERYWPARAGNMALHPDADNHARRIPGIRYEYGDLRDVVNLLKKDPYTRQAYLPIWFPEDTGVVHGERVPCTLGYWFNRSGAVLNVTYLIRSCDIVRHFRNDLYLTYLLLDWICIHLGEVVPGEITTWIGSLHCFESDFYHIKKLIR